MVSEWISVLAIFFALLMFQTVKKSPKFETLKPLTSVIQFRSCHPKMLMSKSSKMLQFINYRMPITIEDGRQLVGKFIAFDREMNLFIGDFWLKSGKRNDEHQRRDLTSFGDGSVTKVWHLLRRCRYLALSNS